MLLEESTRMNASPREVFRFFEEMGENYPRWHPDHVSFRWLEEGGLEAGSEAHFEERIGGKRQEKTVEFTAVDPDRRPARRVALERRSGGADVFTAAPLWEDSNRTARYVLPMEKTPTGTSVGADDPYEYAGVCDHLTSDGNCRLAFERPERDEGFAAARRTEDYVCPVVAEESAFEWDWPDCPHFRSRSTERECERCGLEERRMAHDRDRPLLEEHHLAYPDGPTPHEITVYLCRWCHAKVHNSWARITDDVAPDPEALAEKEERRSRELEELEFRAASERLDNDRVDDERRDDERLEGG